MVARTTGSLDKVGSSKMTNTSIPTAGIDTSKDKLDVAVYGRPGSFTVENSPDGWAMLAARLAEIGVQRVGIEATGGYERGVTRYLQQVGFTVVVLQPLQVKAFAMMRLQRAKSDPIDAGLVAACTFLLDAQNKLPPDPRFDALTDHLTFIEQTEEEIARLKTRREHIADPRLLRILAADIKRLEQRRGLELKRLAGALRRHADLARRVDLVLSIPGIGERTALALVLRLPELGRVSREQAASLAGLAPFVHQSGKRRGETHIGGGRGRLRRSLYAAALPASFRWNPALCALYARLVARGHCHRSALVACARKLLVFANAVVARGTP
ncbi:MAG: IS110 family transposase, partial [Terracidiphilus sp.]